jgi:hypothetical protein
VHEARQGLVGARARFRAIADRVTADDLAGDELRAVADLMPGGRYPSIVSPELTQLAMFLLLAADALTAVRLRLHAQREAIVADQSRYVMDAD